MQTGLRKAVSRSPVLSGASRQTLDRLMAVAQVRSMARCAHLWHAGDAPTALTIIRSGLIKVTRVGHLGRSSICGLFSAPDTVGDMALLRGSAYPAEAVVATAIATLVEIPRGEFLEAVEAVPRLGMSCAQAAHEKLTTLHSRIEVLSAGVVEARLSRLLLDLGQRFGGDLEDGTRIIPIALSRRELGELVSTTFETGIRVISRWEREGIVDTTVNGFLIHIPRELEQFVRRKKPEEPSSYSGVADEQSTTGATLPMRGIE